MPPKSRMRSFTIPAILLGLGSIALEREARGDDPKRSDGRAYSLASDADVSISHPDPQETPIQLTTWTRIDYSLDRKPESLDVLLHSVSLLIKRNGRVSQKSALSRKLFREMPQPGADTVDVPYEKGPAPLRAMLQGFDVPIVSLTLDANGRELGRKARIENEEVKGLMSMTDSIISLHGPFATDAASWESPVILSAGQGQSAKGTLRYEKVGEPDEGVVTVRVSGELPFTGTIAQAQLKNGRYLVSGEQLYDSSAQEWKSGKWTVTIGGQMVNPSNDKLVGTIKGTLILHMGAPETIKTPVEALRIESSRPFTKQKP